MKKIEAVIRPAKLHFIKDALVQYGIRGMTIVDVYGCGLQSGHIGVYRGNTFDVTLLPKVKLEVVVTDDYVDEVIDMIIEHGRTGEVGDGKILIFPVEEAYRIRNGESGKRAL